MIFKSPVMDLSEKKATWPVPIGRDRFAVFDARMPETAWTSAVVDVVYRLGPEYEWRQVSPRVIMSEGKPYIDSPVDTTCYPEVGLQVTTQCASAKAVEFVCVTSNLAYDVGR